MESKTIIKAGGGLVYAPDGRFLMIFRRGYWDLPKGKLEQGETIEQCAVREVQEECGISEITLGEKICTTIHQYELHGVMVEKHSTWFVMRVPHEVALTPQTEEGITQAMWVNEQELPSKLENSYPTIADVFQAVKQ